MIGGELLAIIITDDNLELGQVKTITSNFGKTVDYTELLFSPTTKARFKPNKDRTRLMFSVSDNNFNLPEMICELCPVTLHNLIVSLLNMYNELTEKADNNGNSGDSNKPVEPDKPCCPKPVGWN